MIEFVESEHVYIWDGVIVPSVTQVVGYAVGENYSGVPAAVLAQKAAYGTRLHEWCETWLFTGKDNPLMDETARTSADEFKDMVQRKNVVPKMAEKVVGWQHKVCGRFDILAEVDGKTTLIDIKTNARFPKEYLQMQLSTYRLAIGETLGIDVEALAAIWLPKKKRAKWVDIEPLNDAVVLSMVNDYAINHADAETVLPY